MTGDRAREQAEPMPWERSGTWDNPDPGVPLIPREPDRCGPDTSRDIDDAAQANLRDAHRAREPMTPGALADHVAEVATDNGCAECAEAAAHLRWLSLLEQRLRYIAGHGDDKQRALASALLADGEAVKAGRRD